MPGHLHGDAGSAVWRFTGVGIPGIDLGFAGYYSKDAILEAAWASHTLVGHYGFWCGLIAAFLTAFYSWRLLIMTFHGKPRADHHTMEHVHESPWVMTVPLMVLAAGAVLVGFVFHEQLLGADWKEFWGNAIQIAPTNHVLENMEHVPALVSYAPTVLGLLGIAMAYLFYMFRPGIPWRWPPASARSTASC